MDFDFRNPDYSAVFAERARRLVWLREDPARFAVLRVHYRENPADFINDWGTTFEVRNPERGLPALVPFLLFPKQREWVDWVMERWRAQEPGITEKSRDCGISWLMVALACTLCLFHEGVNIGFGSKKEELIDLLGAPRAAFVRARQFLRYLPREFLNGWDEKKDSPFKRVFFPATGSTMVGEAGDGIGRGDRASIYFVDESSHLERPQLVEASLSQTTNCRIDVSSANGMANPFAQKRHSGKFKVFTFHWRDDPRKDQAWYDKQVAILDPVVVAQEIDINYLASVEGQVIPSAWVQAAIDAHVKLGFEPTGAREAALDVADEGKDNCALAGGHGVLLDVLEEWSGKGSDTYRTVQRAFELCDANGYTRLRYDADGMGALVRGDARVLNELRAAQERPQILLQAFRGSGGVDRPDAEDVKGRKNKDYFANAKAQAWWTLRLKFRDTYRAVVDGAEYDPDNLISISSKLSNLTKLVSELSQPTYMTNATGKIVIDKAPGGSASPNLADAVMMRYSRAKSVTISQTALRAI